MLSKSSLRMLAICLRLLLIKSVPVEFPLPQTVKPTTLNPAPKALVDVIAPDTISQDGKLKHQCRASTIPDQVEVQERASQMMSISASEGPQERWKDAICVKSRFDKLIFRTALPAMVNLAVVPAVTATESIWIGRIAKHAFALAGQSAANSAFLTSFYLIQFLPTLTSPMIASSVGRGDHPQAKKWLCETLTQGFVFAYFGTCFLVGFPKLALGLIMPSDSPALLFAAPYLRIRALSMVMELVSATGVAGFRGMLDTVTPLKIGLASRFVKLVLDPVLLLGTPLGLFGAATATLVAEIVSCGLFVKILFNRKMLDWKILLRFPGLEFIKLVVTSGANMLIRQLAINVAFISSTRTAQTLDPSGVTGAAYGIVNQIYTIGFVVHVAMQGAAAALVPSTSAEKGNGEGRRMADRLFVWGSFTGLLLGMLQFTFLPTLLPLFTQLTEVQEAAKLPAILACLLHIVNGPRFVGEGVMMGLQSFRALTWITVGGVSILIAGLMSPLGESLTGVMMANVLFCSYQTMALIGHYLFVGPLSLKKDRRLKPE